MSSAINSPSVGPYARASIIGLVRWWWLGAVLFVVVALGSIWSAFGPGAQRMYTSSAAASVVALPPAGESSTFDSALIWQHEEATARNVARSGFLNTVTFGQATVSQLAAGGGAAGHLDAGEVARAVSATDVGNVLHLTVRWRGPLAQELAAAAAQALVRLAAAPGLPTEDRAHLVLRERVEVTQPASTAVLDPDVERGRLVDLAVRLGTGLLLAMAAVAAASSITARRPVA